MTRKRQLKILRRRRKQIGVLEEATREELKDVLLALPEHHLVRRSIAWQKAYEETNLMVLDHVVLNALIQLADA